jgi:PAS domain S-box-containing protein
MSPPTPQDNADRVAALEAALAASEAETRKLHAERDLLRSVLDIHPDAVLVTDADGVVCLCNPAAARLFGTTTEALIGSHESARRPFARPGVGLAARGEPEIGFESVTDASAITRHFTWFTEPFRCPEGGQRVLTVAHDLTEVLREQADLREREHRLGFALAATGEGVWDWDLRTGRLGHNATWYALLGFEAPDMSGTIADFERCLLEEDREQVQSAVQACLRGDGPYVSEHRMRRRDGTILRVLDRGDVVERDATGAPLRMVGCFADVTRRAEAHESMRVSLHEKETLLKEIHHRVKNNLQIISSLLTLQAGSVDEPRAQQLLRDSVVRVRSMALIHQKLYSSDNLARVDFGDYATALARELVSNLAPEARVVVEAVPVDLSPDQAIPCGLLLTELLTNALKHGSDAEGHVHVRVHIARQGDGFQFTVTDDGPGLPPALNPAKSTSLGLQLVHSLARQLRAKVTAERDGGARFLVAIPKLT